MLTCQPVNSKQEHVQKLTLCCFSKVRSKLPPASREAEGARDIKACPLCLLGPLRGRGAACIGSIASACTSHYLHALHRRFTSLTGT